MSRLTDLIARAKATDAALGQELEREFKVLSTRRSFGLNFERHRPESVELPGRPIRKGDKVHTLPPRGLTSKGDQRLWKVMGFEGAAEGRMAKLELLYSVDVERLSVAVADLVVVSEFKDYIYPGLISTGKVERSDAKPFHTVINGENFHVLEALTFTHRGRIDAIYIDPPYNSGAKDWKYNNDYVEKDDIYRHSKWLAMVERRLIIARQLLNPRSSALVVTIDEKEYLRLGMLLEQTFPDAHIQMVSSQINAKGIIRDNEFSRTNEFIFFVIIGNQRITPELKLEHSKKVRWASLRRSDVESARGTPKGGPEQFYPIYVDKSTGEIKSVGLPLKANEPASNAPAIPGCHTVLPIRDKGEIREMNWGLTASTLESRLKKGYVKAVLSGKSKDKITIYYLMSGQVADIENGHLAIDGYDKDGAAIVSFVEGKRSNPTTQWAKDSHNAQSHGSDLIKSLISERKFPFPKSLYAVEDALRILLAQRKDAIVLDFFAGSGTTAHAVMRLNRQDGGFRHCISVTNNEVGAEEQSSLRKQGLRPGDPEWEQWGICDYITKPRIAAAISGRTPDGKPIKGDYKFNDEFPMSEGFQENAEFFTLTYETPVAVGHNRAFERIAPLLWMRAGSEGRRIGTLPTQGWDVADRYGILIDLDKAAPFEKAVVSNEAIRLVFIVTDDDRRFQAVVRQLPGSVDTVRLYESYLNNFRFSMGR